MVRAGWLATLAVAVACDEPAPSVSAREPVTVLESESQPWSDAWLLREGERFIHDTAYRRAALEHSLVNPDNLYSSQRRSPKP